MIDFIKLNTESTTHIKYLMVNIFLFHDQHLLKNSCVCFAVYLQREIIVEGNNKVSICKYSKQI